MTTENSALMEALEPFAAKARQFSAQADGMVTIQMDFAHFRRAAEALSRPTQSSGEKMSALIDGMLDRIHWQIDCEVKRDDVAELIGSLDEYGMAFVSIPQWTVASEAQHAVDAFYKGDADARLIEAARAVIEGKFSTYRARNGRQVGVEGDDGEKVWLVHSEPMSELESAYAAMKDNRRPAPLSAEREADGEAVFRDDMAGVTPELAAGNVSINALAALLKRGAENQKPRSRQVCRGEFDAEADARFILACIKKALSAPAQPVSEQGEG